MFIYRSSIKKRSGLLWNPNSRNFIPAELKKSKISCQKSIVVSFDSNDGSGNCERFCFSDNFNAFPSRFQQSRIRELRKIFGQEGHQPPPKFQSARKPMKRRTVQCLLKLNIFFLNMKIECSSAISGKHYTHPYDTLIPVVFCLPSTLFKWGSKCLIAQRLKDQQAQCDV